MFDTSPITPLVLVALMGFYALGGFVKGAAGFGQPMVTIPLASLFLPVPKAIAITIAPVIVSNVVQLIQNRRALAAARDYWVFYLSLALAMMAGLTVLSSASHERLLVLVGALILVFVTVQFTRWQPHVATPMRARTQLATGLISGLLGGVTSFVSFPAIPVLVACRLPREVFSLLVCVMFLLAGSILSTGLSVIGVFGPPEVLATTLCVLPTAGGQMLGQYVRDRLPERGLRLVVFAMLGAMGLSLILRGLL